MLCGTHQGCPCHAHPCYLRLSAVGCNVSVALVNYDIAQAFAVCLWRTGCWTLRCTARGWLMQYVRPFAAHAQPGTASSALQRLYADDVADRLVTTLRIFCRVCCRWWSGSARSRNCADCAHCMQRVCTESHFRGRGLGTPGHFQRIACNCNCATYRASRNR